MLKLLVAVLAASAIEESYRAGDREFPDCDSARTFAEAQHEAIRVSCVYEAEYHSGETTAESPERSAAAWRLEDFRPTGEFELSDRDASAVTFVDAETVLISYQSFLEFRNLAGELLASVGPVDGDLEGLERRGAQIIALAEQGSRHEDLVQRGFDFEHLGGSALPQAGLECVAYDQATGETWYGQDSTGKLYDSAFEVVLEFGRDLSGCTVHDGWLIAVTSDEWRDSFWYRIDATTFEILDRLPLPRGNWEGVACEGRRCVLVQEASEGSPASMLVLERESP